MALSTSQMVIGHLSNESNMNPTSAIPLNVPDAIKPTSLQDDPSCKMIISLDHFKRGDIIHDSQAGRYCNDVKRHNVYENMAPSRQ